MEQTQVVKKGVEVEVAVEKLAFGGKAVSRVNGFVVFIDHGVPGQIARVRITRKKRQYAEARVIEVVRQSPDYTDPFCVHFKLCGGCSWQDIPYAEQLRWKRQHVADCLEHVAGVGEARVESCEPSPRLTFYRNKMEYTFSDRRWLSDEEIASKDTTYGKSCALGLHVSGFFDKVFNVEQCFLESPESVAVLKSVRDWCAGSGVPAYSIRTHKGYWRFLVVREGKFTDQVLVHLLTADEPGHDRHVDALVRHLVREFPSITTFVHSVTGKKAQVALGDSSRVVLGPGVIEERLGSLRFRISAHSFFQTNPFAAMRMYETVESFAELNGTETVWDLYCGTGSIALFIASRARRVVGFEVVEDAVRDAYENCRYNGIENCSFVAGDLKDMISRGSDEAGSAVPDVLIADPPRAGMHPHVVKTVLELAPKRIVYVSCNPSTLARDLTSFLETYKVERVLPFDFFPHTPHIECVVKLVRKA
ncbi:MAG: 23S rRNA (uracil(1939)-C(5))-methyltransferase RlmD [Syntrophobacteraceae bacterium]|nr:23S rRNA (uracil(1939)-C(5))-methyltransferase RlmD [Syntrophobacteraceae bacterium]